MIIPTFFVSDVSAAIEFYTGILDFRLAAAFPESDPFYAVLVRGGDELHLNRVTPLRGAGSGVAIVTCDTVDERFGAFRARGLVLPDRPESPVHRGPVDQSWGTREVYVDDPDGNTIIFQQR